MKERIAYILNPEKTEGLFFVNSLNCFINAEDVYQNMKWTYERFSGHMFEEPKPENGKARVKLLHYVQSFSPDDNVTPELAHRMGLAFIRKAFGDNVQVVIATHTDKAHIHNHLIINTYGINGHKFNDNKKTLSEIREISDRVCLAFDIQPIMNNKHMGVTYKEWAARRDGTSWKEQIRREIDTLVMASKNFDELAATLEEKGYEIKYGMHTSVRAPGQKRFTRLKTLGDEYTIDGINSRILWKDDLGNASREDAYNKGQELTIRYSGAISRLAKLIIQGKKEEYKYDDNQPYMPYNDHDVFELSTQLALIYRLRIRSVHEINVKQRKLEEKIKKMTDEFNAITVRHAEVEKLLQQVETYNDLSNRDKLSLSEKMRLQIIKQALSHNDALDERGVERLTKEYRDLNKKTTALKDELENCYSLQKALDTIKDTFNEMSREDYVNNLVMKTHSKKDSTTQDKESHQHSDSIPSHDKKKPKL